MSNHNCVDFFPEPGYSYSNQQKREVLAMKLATYNIRYDCGTDGINNFSCRKEFILETIRRESPDIIGFQEVLPHVAAWLKENLTGYYVVGCPRCEDLTGEQVCIAFRPDRFNLMKMDTFWLSPTPNVPGSRYPEQSICPRSCTEVVLQELAGGKVLRMINTHFDHEGSLARLLAARQILARLESPGFFPDAPVVFVGDLNAEPDSPEIRLLSSRLHNLTEGIGITYHSYGGSSSGTIDYIFLSGAIRGSAPRKWDECRDGLYLSDHYPISAELTLL